MTKVIIHERTEQWCTKAGAVVVGGGGGELQSTEDNGGIIYRQLTIMKSSKSLWAFDYYYALVSEKMLPTEKIPSLV